MSLSFLSGDAGSNSIKMLQARAYAREAAKNILRARALENEINTVEDIEFIGLDEIGNKDKRQQKKQARQEKRQDKRQARQDKRSGGGQNVDTEEDQPIPAPAPPPAPGRSAKIVMPGLPAAPVQSRAAAPVRSKAMAPAPLTVRPVAAASVPAEEARRQVQEFRAAAAESAEQAERSAGDETTGGFLSGKNLLIFGGISLAAITGIYFLSRKK
jgi:hypothetical protein